VAAFGPIGPRRVKTIVEPFHNATIDTTTNASYAHTMEVHFSNDQEAQLAQIAAHAGTDPEQLVKNAALQLVDDTARFRAAVREGIAQADRGELIDDDHVLQWLEDQESR
jgi:predicted transcriptional regulator